VGGIDPPALEIEQWSCWSGSPCAWVHARHRHDLQFRLVDCGLIREQAGAAHLVGHWCAGPGEGRSQRHQNTLCPWPSTIALLHCSSERPPRNSTRAVPVKPRLIRLRHLNPSGQCGLPLPPGCRGSKRRHRAQHGSATHGMKAALDSCVPPPGERGDRLPPFTKQGRPMLHFASGQMHLNHPLAAQAGA